ncbi:DUF2147 domain-containing protein [Lacimonas salitolerans]|uniref:DUF2147 domain-containing protein n=1 Tax=Lacimonas salitolerans TaxID=1323750 RepID=A0ABW4ECF9_9RHOB
MKRFSYAMTIVLGLPGMAAAEPILGTWLTGPDNKDQVAHMQLSRCGEAICGKVARAFDQSGDPVTTPNVGKQVIWDVTPETGAGKYNGKVLLPLYGATVNGDFTVAGDHLTLKGCMGPICRSQNWTRVQ